MGCGVALQFKEAFPDNFKAYAAACNRQELQPGKMFVFQRRQLRNPKFIINFPTKRHWRGQSRIGDIEAGLQSLVKEIRERHIGSIAMPPLGSGPRGSRLEPSAPANRKGSCAAPEFISDRVRATRQNARST